MLLLSLLLLLLLLFLVFLFSPGDGQSALLYTLSKPRILGQILNAHITTIVVIVLVVVAVVIVLVVVVFVVFDDEISVDNIDAVVFYAILK